MPRYLVEVLEIKVQRKIVVSVDYLGAIDCAKRDFNIIAKGVPNETLDAKVIRTLPDNEREIQ